MNPAIPFDGELRRLLNELLTLREEIVLRANRRLRTYSEEAEKCKGACNLAHYLALREVDRRPLQAQLARYGLSSLGRGEPHVLATIDAIIRVLQAATGQPVMMTMSEICPVPGFDEGSELLERNTVSLFGPTVSERSTRIMVTLPAEAATNERLLRDLLQRGTDCVRINCAHDDRQSWAGMVGNVRRISDELGRHCRILMDLAGHKIRTGPIRRSPSVLHLRVRRDQLGRISEPARLLLVPEDSPFVFEASPDVVQLTLPVAWIAHLEKGARLIFSDTRDKPRCIEVEHEGENGSWQASCAQPVWIGGDTCFTLHRTGQPPLELGVLGSDGLPSEPERIRVFRGDRLLLGRDAKPGQAALCDEAGRPAIPARIGCTMPQVLSQVAKGEPVWIDDGRIGAVVEEKTAEGLLLRITHAAPGGAKVREDKGLNFPSTSLQLPPLSERDLEDLDFVCGHADMVGFSFVESLDDMQQLMMELERRGATNMPVVAKIETQAAVSNLPEILLGSIGRRQLGIMIARGDLAVELGSVRMAEIQEEILWLCEAAHVPVIWATQVLETIAKKGVRSRPEFTDAAMGVRAECVMLNKGPYINDAVEALDRVLIRMQDHQHKKFSRMRALHLRW